MSGSRLRERVWTPDSDPTFTTTMIPDWRAEPPTALSSVFGYAAYVEGVPPRPVLIYLSSSREDVADGEVRFLQTFLDQSPPRSYMDALFLLDYFLNEGPCVENVPDPRSLRFPARDVVDGLLRDARGMLLWSYQLEALIRLAGLAGTETACLRRDVSARRADALDRLKQLRIPGGETLFDVAMERMRYGYVISPNYRGAAALWAALQPPG